jgi:ribosome-associated heat shock protein Hsp15
VSGGDGQERQRVDVWLWRTRFFKSRSAAAGAVEAGAVRLFRAGQSRALAKPGERVLVGDALTFLQGRVLRSIEVVAYAERRGPAPEARACYRDLVAAPD